MSAETWATWREYYNVEPWGEDRADWRAGMIASVLAETHRDRKRRVQPYKPSDFMPVFDRPPVKEQTPDEQLAILRQWVQVLGGTDATKAA